MQLVVISGPDQGRAFSLAEGETLVIGRGRASHTRLGDASVSRVHCCVDVDGGHARLIDSGGAGGTTVNGKAIDQHELRPGDVVLIGQTQLRFQLDGTEDDPTSVGLRPVTPKPRQEVEPLEDLLGRSLSYFRLDKVLAQGSTGTVFLARDTEHDRLVAMKVLEPQYAGDEENIQRFVRAMKTMLPVRHENIVLIYAAGKNSGYCWVAMEYVDGESLAKVIERIGTVGQLDWKDAFRAAVHVARALEAAYGHRIVHRNITPRSILLRKSDKVAKLGDLMLAKALEGSLARQVTRVGQLVGELVYLSPEQTRSDAGVDGRSDIYSLGATVYALLTGHPPFESDSPAELITKIRHQEPVNPRQYQLGIPELFADQVVRMLAKEPLDRYQTPTELVSDLLRVGRYQGIEM